MPWFPWFKGWRQINVEGNNLPYCPECYQLVIDIHTKTSIKEKEEVQNVYKKQMIGVQRKKPHPETIEALKKIRKELERGTVSIESDTWRMMANRHILNCIMDDIQHERISSEDASMLQQYNEMTRTWKERLVTTLEETHEDTSRGECSEIIDINAPTELVWRSWRDMKIISHTLIDGSAGRIDETHFWIKRVDPDKRDIWLETYEEIKLSRPTYIIAQEVKIEVQTTGMDFSLQEVDLEGVWLDYVDFEEISKNKTKLIFRTSFIPSKPMTDYGKIFLAMFTQTEFHPTMKEEIQNQLKKFKELVESQ